MVKKTIHIPTMWGLKERVIWLDMDMKKDYERFKNQTRRMSLSELEDIVTELMYQQAVGSIIIVVDGEK